MSNAQASRGHYAGLVVRARRVVATALAPGLALGGCDAGDRDAGQRVPGGDPGQGGELLQAYGCTACHAIPGLTIDPPTIAPPLDDWSERAYIAGSLVNTPDNLMYWIMDPDSVEPGTAMPDLGVDAEEARHMAAYLFSLGASVPPLPAVAPAARGAF